MAYRSWIPFVLLLAACDPADAPDEADDFVEATADVAVLFCECTVEADGGDPEACEQAADEVLDAEVRGCIRDAAERDPEVEAVLTCTTDALRELLECYGDAAICPELDATTATGPGDDDTSDDDEPISDDACGAAFEAAAEACGDVSPETTEALDACLGNETEGGRNCTGDDC